MPIIEVGPHTRMTPEQALTFCSREQWSDVAIIGYHKGDRLLVVRSSAMTRADALNLYEQAKLHALGVL